MKKEVLEELIYKKAEELRKQRSDFFESEGHWAESRLNNVITEQDYREAMIEVLAELL